MDLRRILLLAIFSFSLAMLWDAWVNGQRPPEAVASQSQSAVPGGGVPQAPQTGAAQGVPTPSVSAVAAADVPQVAGAAVSGVASTGASVTVRTDLVVAEVSALGGQIVRLELNKHKAGKGSADGFVLFEHSERHTYAAQTGLIGDGLPNHRTEYRLPDGDLTLADGQDTLTLRLEAPEANGVKVTKVLTFHRDSYIIDVAYEIANGRAETLNTHAYFQFARDGKAAEGVEAVGVSTFTGPAFFTEAEKYRKIKFEEIAEGKAKVPAAAQDGWVALVQHYFVGAWLPAGDAQREFFARKIGPDLYTAGLIMPVAGVAPGQSTTVGSRLFAGPQEQSDLDALAPGFGLVVDYGWLTVIAAPLFWALSKLHLITGNWGWAIILVTIAIKLMFFPLSAASYKSMAKMRVLGPRMARLKELYGHDKARMQQETMDMYRKEKINPLGGCLPILVQIPVFIALYWVLLGSVEMRHAPWLGWIQDLSAKDPYYILPVLMGVSMFVQTKLNPTPPDPIQAKVMLFLPLVFTFMFMWFPSGLVLYWVVNNTLSIAQQWQITRMIEGAKKSGAKPA